jgi:hypothetical protein
MDPFSLRPLNSDGIVRTWRASRFFAVGSMCVFCRMPMLLSLPAVLLGVEVASAGPHVFLETSCWECHTGPSVEGGLDLSALSTDLSQPEVFARWERLYDRVARGEMPPPASDPPPAAAREAFLASLAVDLNRAHAAVRGTVLRRLNRREYQNTLNDLFGTNVKLAEILPEDGRSHEFDTVGEALGISSVQMQRYMDGIRLVFDQAIGQTPEPAPVQIVRASYADTRGAEQWLGKIWLHRDDGAVVFFKNHGYPSGMLREAAVQVDGWYTVRVTGYAYQSDKPITFALGATTFARGMEQPTFGYFQLPPGRPSTIETTAWIPARYMIDLTVYGINDQFALKTTPVADYQGPGLAITQIEVEGPLTDSFPSRGHRLVFDGLTRQEIPPRNPAERQKPWYKPKFAIVAERPREAVMPVLRRVVEKAFRRPVEEQQIAPYLELFSAELASGSTFEESLLSAVTAIFCAPDFLFLREDPGRLDDYALASRLAYFLTRSAPDDELLAQAAAGALTSDPEMLQSQAERLLADARSERFLIDFTDAWLNLREIDFTVPDRQLFPEFDPFLQWSMLAETRAFIRRLLDDNREVVSLVKSDFAMLNSRLAEHYGIPGVEGPDLRPVSLPPTSVRGGLLGQGSVLKVSANGTNTSPVVRGVWVTERILGQRAPPPPPGVPGVEPDVRGATTLRELLDRHRSHETCRGCHQKIDPPGFALERFDPIGGWRERFRCLEGGERLQREVNGIRVRYQLGLPVDASGALADGRVFSDFVGFRDLLASDGDLLARAFTTKLLTFATGREIGFSDRDEVERIVQMTRPRGHRLRDLMRAVVSSEIFRTK